MKIVFLGWGSLIWSPDVLKIKGEWKKDGPNLPIEFARISSYDRLTLVLHPDSPKVTTLWADADFKDLNEAIENLRLREGTSTRYIGFLCIPKNTNRCNVVEHILPEIEQWANNKQIQAVVWTDLPSTFDQLTLQDAINHLRKLNRKNFEKASEYILKAPEQIQTKFRSSLENELCKNTKKLE